jgi:hypothetical protein
MSSFYVGMTLIGLQLGSFMKTWRLVLMSRSRRDSAATGLGNRGTSRQVLGEFGDEQVFLGDPFPGIIGFGRFATSAIPLR